MLLNQAFFRTTAFRLGMLYSLIFSVLIGSILYFLYFELEKQLYRQVDRRLRAESNMLLSLYRQHHFETLNQVLLDTINPIDQYGRIYLLRPSNDWLPFGFVPQDLRIVNHRYFSLDAGATFEGFEQDPLTKPARVVVTHLSDNARLIIALDINTEHQLMSRNLKITAFASAATLLLALCFGALFAGRVSRRIHSMNSVADRVVHGDLSRRMPLDGREDEYHALAIHFNKMLDRIEELVRNSREMSDNIAHDLRGPLTRLRSNLEELTLDERLADELREALRNAIEDVDSLLRIFNSLLKISRLEARVTENLNRFDANQVCHQVVEIYEPVAEENQRSLLCRLCPEACFVTGDANMLAQALSNLLENAFKYTPEDSGIEVSSRLESDSVILAVADHGPGIPEEERTHYVKRLVRGEQERATPGNGLGLSLTQAIVRFHQGDMVLSNNEPGLRVELRMPKATNEKS